MPSTIPYDPNLVLTSVVGETALKSVEEVAKAQAPVDAAQDALNSLISSKRSLMMTKTELRNLNVSTDALDTELVKLDTEIENAAAAYATAKMTAKLQAQKLRENMRAAYTLIESPVDYMRSEVKTMPLAADTLNMDVQYFPFESNTGNSAAHSAQIASYVSGSVSTVFSSRESMSIGAAASSQVSRQIRSNSIEGTLVLAASCTHKNASIVAPFVLDVDKAIQVWNRLFPGSKLDPKNETSMMKICMNESQEDKQRFSVISGTTFGSSFVGMVHVLSSSNNSPPDSLISAAQSLQATMDVGGWLAKGKGKTGIDSRFASDVERLLNEQNITSRVTLLTTGVVPSNVANEPPIAVEKFAALDLESNTEAVAAMQNATSVAPSTVKLQTQDSQIGGQSAGLQGKAIESSLSVLATVDDGENKVLDTNFMMRALDDYLKKAAEGTSGVPINYYLKDIDMKMLAQMWAAKHYPGKFMPIKYDDTEGAGPAADSGQEKAKL